MFGRSGIGGIFCDDLRLRLLVTYLVIYSYILLVYLFGLSG